MRNYRYIQHSYNRKRRISDMAGMSRSQRLLAQLILLAFIVGCVLAYIVFVVR